MQEENIKSLSFIEQMVEKDLAEGLNDRRVQTRFPPEPNGNLHIGHAKAICLDFGIAQRYGGTCNLRFDDTNPTKEEIEYVEAIQEDIQWLGFDWGEVYYASDYFQQLYDFAIRLIKRGDAYIDEQTSEQIARQKGTPTQPGVHSPFRDRPVEENLDLFRRMSEGEFEEGAMTLRAKIDMASPNMHFRDPVIYRIVNTPHHRTGTTWKVYPMYDFAHGQSDYFEGVTHSLCTLEFEVHRPLYDYYIDLLLEETGKNCGDDFEKNKIYDHYRPRQTEFNRLNMTYTIMSKRKLLRLVQEGRVQGWDDPRMPTIAGMRRRGYPAEAIRTFCENIGVAKRESTVDLALLEHFVRQNLNLSTPRVMAVLRPLRVVIENYPEDLVEEMECINNPEDSSKGTRLVPFSRVIYIDEDDFREVPPPKYYRLSPGKEVRLRSAYMITCTGVTKDPETGKIIEITAKYDPATRGGNAPDGRKVKSTIHWVSAAHAIDAEVRLYDTLFAKENPEEIPEGQDSEGQDFTTNLNPTSLEILKDCKLEPSLANSKPGERYQFERVGYFYSDPKDSQPGSPVFNRIVTLKDAWARIVKRQG